MQKKIQIWQVIILISLCGLTATNSKGQTQQTNFADVSATTRPVLNGANLTNAGNDCEAELAAANARLNKTLDALEKAETLIASLKTENEALSKLNTVNGEIIAAQKTQIEASKEEITLLKKKSERKISFLFGILKIRF